MRRTVHRERNPAVSPDAVIAESRTGAATVVDAMNARDPDASIPPAELNESEPFVVAASNSTPSSLKYRAGDDARSVK